MSQSVNAGIQGEVPYLTLKVGQASSPGPRAENQDRECAFQCPLGEGFLVADGMGGRNGGATAAQIVVDRMPQLLGEYGPESSIPEALREASHRLNEEMHAAQRADSSLQDMGSTMVLALFKDGECWIAHVGDSRAYLFRNGHLTRLTTDHTVAQKTLGAVGASDEEIRRHPDASVLTQVVGQRSDLVAEIHGPLFVTGADAVLLCTDGLSGFATDAQIEAVLQQTEDTDAVSQALQDLASNVGSTDNVTVQFIQVAREAVSAIPQPVVSPAATSRRLLWGALAAIIAFVLLLAVWFGAWRNSGTAGSSIEMKLDR